MSGLTIKDVVHHGVEGGICIGLGACVFSSLTTAAVVYGAGKVTYLSTKRLLEYCPVEISKGLNRSISWVAGVAMSGTSLLLINERVGGAALNGFTDLGKMLGVFGVSLTARALCDKQVKHYLRAQHQH